MATTDEFNESVEAAIKKLLLTEYPHIKTSILNRVCETGAGAVAYQFQYESRRETANVRPLKFFDLPREIRDVIYEYVVKPSDGLPITLNKCPRRTGCAWAQQTVDIFNPMRSRYPEEYVHGEQPAITRVSRQLRQEALPLFYHVNVFAVCLARDAHPPDPNTWYFARYLENQDKSVGGVELLANWLVGIGEKNVSDLAKITAHYTEEKEKEWLLELDLVPVDRLDLVHIQDSDREGIDWARTFRDRARDNLAGLQIGRNRW
ncbi:hypothetical protein PRZ48_010726 [Zasmidium cellare]|uniref:Uncharacterized protein n=1 Tax=Zasmidium cellare TaxID=395010 RepID=A0ABR0EA06_ZASCE|nr:hypothetical protein PRZ48_010726 [Zasmidium cellare]